MFVKLKSEQISELYAETDFVNLQVEGRQEDCPAFGFHSQDPSQQREAFSHICPAQQCPLSYSKGSINGLENS